MNKRIQNYVDDLFKQLPKNESILETKEELIVNLNEKYQDLISEGFTQEEAFRKVAAGVGDIEELVSYNQTQTVHQKVEVNVMTHPDSSPKLYTALGALCMVLAPAGFFLGIGLFRNGPIGFVLLFSIGSLGVMFFILGGSIKGRKKASNYQSLHEGYDRKRSALHSIVYLVATLLFLSNFFGYMGASWTIYIVAYLVTIVLDLSFDLIALNQVDETESGKSNFSILGRYLRKLIWPIVALIFFTGNNNISIIVLIIAAIIFERIIALLFNQEDKQ